MVYGVYYSFEVLFSVWLCFSAEVVLLIWVGNRFSLTVF